MESYIVEDWMGASPDGRMHLRAQRCGACGVTAWPPSTSCKSCGSRALSRVEIGPDAELYAVTTDRMGTFLGYPHLVGQVRFPEGVFAQGFVLGDADAPPAVGSDVELVPFGVESGGEQLITYAFKVKEG